MDDSFRKMSEELKASYDSSFWEQAKVQLENDALDDAFRQAADNVSGFSGVEIASESLSDAFMDDAFRDAAANMAVTYNPSFWAEMSDAEAALMMDESFQSASKNTKANYNPVYWGDANSALEREGLHYEYNTAYWNEAKSLLDKADRRLFFAKWAGVAAILLLISTAGLKLGVGVEYANSTKAIEKTARTETTFEPSQTNERFEREAVVIANEDVDLNQNSVTAAIQSQSNASMQSYGSQNEIENLLSPDLTDNSVENTIVEEIGINEQITNEIIMPNHIPEENEVSISIENQNSIVNEENGDRQYLEFVERINNRRNWNETKTVLTTSSMIELDKVKLNPIRTFSFIGGYGFGKGFGVNPGFNLPRAYAGLEYLSRGFGKLKRFEFGGSVAIQGIQEDGLIREKRTVRHLENTDSVSSWTKLKINELLYLNVNLLVNYRLTSKQLIKFGVGIDRLVGVRSNMAYFNGDDQDATTKQQNIRMVNNNWGVQNGILKNDLRFSLGYEYRLNHKLSFQTNFNYGLFDRTEDKFYDQNATFDNETNVTLGIRYTFFTKI